jgi:hypothetical protein
MPSVCNNFYPTEYKTLYSFSLAMTTVSVQDPRDADIIQKFRESGFVFLLVCMVMPLHIIHIVSL